jgi:hypothetical protein
MKLATVALLCAASAALAADEDPIENARLPRLWKVVERTKIPAAQVAGVSKKLGVGLTSLERNVLDAGGIRVQVNVARCADVQQAEAAQPKFEAVHGGDKLFVVRRGADLAELVCDNRVVARKMRDVLGWDVVGDAWAGPMYYKVTMQVAPLERCDGMRWNKLFNLLRASGDGANAAEIEAEAKAFTFAETKGAERVHGVPRVQRVAHVTVPVFRTSGVEDDGTSWTASTEWWPTDAPEVKAAVQEALGEDAPTDPRGRAERILGWVQSHVRYGGDQQGSRWGAMKAIRQGFGRCWDFSDVFVTLCRAAGVPARQVGGWLKGSEGHVWAEVVVGEGKNDGKPAYREVLPVDPTTTWLGVSGDYIRLWTSEDGRTPFVYWGFPKIEQLACIK